MTTFSIIQRRAREAPDAIALHAPGRETLKYAQLYDHVVRTVAALRRRNLRRDDIVAVVLPNGPEMATAFLSVSAAAVCAPLNPAYRADEFSFYLGDLPAKALMVSGLSDCPAREVARTMGIPIIELASSVGQPAGLFELHSDQVISDPQIVDAPHDDDVALVLHTSGTTSRPKIVPLAHGNLSASARHISATLRLTPQDRCLNVMPLFHIHGLMAAVLSSLEAGGSVVCTPGFIAPSFFDWMNEFRPSWYTAVPTMHASILSRADANRAVIASHSLRFIRSSSAALPRTVLSALEDTFGVPVVEAYGMTEAAHQMASNPLPPHVRKPGTVGPAAGPAISILDSRGGAVANGSRGEIAIRGPNVTKGYARNPDANAAAFANGWLRTGDEGVLDEDGYLTILGRLKEMINRGGEKISPLEVDEILLAHPAVAQAVTFGATDAVLGEEVAAAVVLRPDMRVSERQLREFAAARLAHFKVPRRVLFMPAIPTGATGKMQRIGLAEKLGVAFEAPPPPSLEHVAPTSAVEEILASIWSSVLATDSPGVNDNFFYAGGDSTLAAQFVARVRDTLAIEISLLAFFDSPTIAGIAAIVEESMSAESPAIEVGGVRA
ncbi:MAG TPA: AMP-binding protein [Gemmatimonadaceae bacterium]|nr:AMP-binding protein [Gemmatimonadaceae bacterium]